MLGFAHIINPVVVGEASDLYKAQPVTFESMRLAKLQTAEDVRIEVFSAQYLEDRKLVPEWISLTKDLNRSILDIRNFQRQRKLPLIKDILDRLYDASHAEYFIYSNVDIALMPYFYSTIARIIESGIDGMIINRRTIAKFPSNPGEISMMWAQSGEKHPGYDCFVFRRDVYPHFELGTTCIGANWIGRVLLANIHAHAENFKIFEDLHLTFHLGDDRSWKIHQFSDYDQHNENELLKILKMFREEGKLEEYPLLEQFYQDILNGTTNLEPQTFLQHLKRLKRRLWSIRIK